jgi:hypothetical protein
MGRGSFRKTAGFAANIKRSKESSKSCTFFVDIHIAWPYKSCNIIASPSGEAGL